MSIATLPEDSVLRRHAETEARYGRLRVVEGQRQQQGSTAASTPRSAGGGMFGWLKRLFGG